jgi:hypothetical protein
VLPTRRQRIEDQRVRRAARVSGGVGIGDDVWPAAAAALAALPPVFGRLTLCFIAAGADCRLAGGDAQSGGRLPRGVPMTEDWGRTGRAVGSPGCRPVGPGRPAAVAGTADQDRAPRVATFDGDTLVQCDFIAVIRRCSRPVRHSRARHSGVRAGRRANAYRRPRSSPAGRRDSEGGPTPDVVSRAAQQHRSSESPCPDRGTIGAIRERQQVPTRKHVGLDAEPVTSGPALKADREEPVVLAD